MRGGSIALLGLACAATAAAFVAGVAPVLARSGAILPYPAAEVWSSAVRFVRVDRGYVIREKDEGSGYILFDAAEGPKATKGALEIIATRDAEGREATRAVFSLPDLPRHYEIMLLDKLAAKVKEERGSPAPPPSRKTPGDRPPADAGPPTQAR